VSVPMCFSSGWSPSSSPFSPVELNDLEFRLFSAPITRESLCRSLASSLAGSGLSRVGPFSTPGQGLLQARRSAISSSLRACVRTIMSIMSIMIMIILVLLVAKQSRVEQSRAEQSSKATN